MNKAAKCQQYWVVLWSVQMNALVSEFLHVYHYLSDSRNSAICTSDALATYARSLKHLPDVGIRAFPIETLRFGRHVAGSLTK